MPDVTVKEDIIFLSRYRRNLEGGMVISRQFKVSNLTGQGNIKSMAWSAMVAPGIPRLGDPHPAIFGVIVDDLTADPVNNSPGQITVVATYRDLSVVRCRVNGNVVRDTTRLDKYAKLIAVKYKAGNHPSTPPAGGEGRQPCENVEILRPGMTLEFDFWVCNNQNNYVDPYTWIKDYQGKCNSEKWQGCEKAWAWLCSEVSVMENRKKGEVRVQHVRLGFIYKERFQANVRLGVHDNWTQLFLYRHPYTREIPRDVDPETGGAFKNTEDGDTGNGYKRFYMYDLADFNGISPIIPDLFAAK